jgi:flagellar basal-body rod modification protein FlgD
MDFPLMLNEQDLYRTKLEIESFNKSIQASGRKVRNTLGKDDFLRLLVVQLENQDPTSPLNDQEFIAQMAQFSALEQMTEMNRTLSNIVTNAKINLSYSLLGRQVEVLDRTTGAVQGGTVSEVSFGTGVPTVSFDGLTYSVDDITKVSVKK